MNSYLSIQTIIDQRDLYYAELQKANAQVAVMREALEIGIEWMGWWLQQDGCECEEGYHFCGRSEREKELRQMKQALSTTAGQDFLERYKRMEKVVEAAKKARNYLSQLVTEETCLANGKCEHFTSGECEFFDAYYQLDEALATLKESEAKKDERT